MIVTFPIAFLFEIFFPIALAFWFTRRYHTRWSLVWIGALVFIVSQVLHLPTLNGINSLFANRVLHLPPPQYLLAFSAILGGLLAGIFEETARLVAYWLLKDRARSWKAGVTLGIGHGGAESALFVGVAVMASYVTMMLARYAPDVLGSATVAQLQGQMAAFFATSWDLPLAGAVERLGTIITQIAFSVIVLQTFIRRNALWYVGAVIWHAVIDGVTVLLGHTLSVWPTEGVLMLFALINLWIILALRRGEPREPQLLEPVAPGPITPIPPELHE